MVRLIAQYRIQEEAFEEVQNAIKKFISTVKIEEPETKDAAYTLEFVETLYPLCVDEPTFTPISFIERK